MNKQASIGYVSTYPPRACGIATFTRDLSQALQIRRHVERNVVVAVEDDPSLDSLEQIIYKLDRSSYVRAAGFLNESNVNIVSLQHEFGIYGGEWGDYVLDLCKNVEAPLITTFHTVVANPPEKARELVREICRLSTTVVVTVESAKKLLEEEYGIDSQKIEIIPHGASTPDRRRRTFARRSLHLQKHTVLATTGLINPGKGIEYAIKALPYLVRDQPDILYLVIGETHPEVRKHEGEAYRNKLMALARQLKVEKNVRFVDRYLHEDELSLYLQATDIYLAPYLGKDQVSSGTITYALTHGKPVVSTPTLFAKDVLSNSRGLLCKFSDAPSIAACVKQILSDPGLRRKLGVNAFKYGQEVGWAHVADEYGYIIKSAIRTRRTIAKTAEIGEA